MNDLNLFKMGKNFCGLLRVLSLRLFEIPDNLSSGLLSIICPKEKLPVRMLAAMYMNVRYLIGLNVLVPFFGFLF